MAEHDGMAREEAGTEMVHADEEAPVAKAVTGKAPVEGVTVGDAVTGNASVKGPMIGDAVTGKALVEGIGDAVTGKAAVEGAAVGEPPGCEASKPKPKAAGQRLPQQSIDERFMRLALVEARLAAAEGEVPIGAVVVCGGRVVAHAHNRRELDHDPSAHAEFRAMVAAAQNLDRWRLSGCTVYVTVEPCLMCAGLMVNARIERCVFGAPDPKGGALGTLYDVSHDMRLNHEFEVTSGVLASECAQVMRDFFRARRAEQKRRRKADQAAG